MEVTNSLAKTNAGTPKTFTKFIAQDGVKNGILAVLRSENALNRFVADITSVVSNNPALQACDYATIISGALVANSLKLSLSPSLGFAYLVPFQDKKNNRTTAVFVPGYKGYIQLAVRSGYYADIDVKEIKEGEYLGRDAKTGNPKFSFIEDDAEYEKRPTVGYMAFFEYLNGFKKVLYWSQEKMERHADRYSPAFSLSATSGRFPKVSYEDFKKGNYPKSDEWKYSSFWYKDFTGMAFKTMLRQLITKWGIMSVDMEHALNADNERPDGTAELSESMTDDFFDVPQNDAAVQETEETDTKKVRKKKSETEAEIVSDADFFVSDSEQL